jgi:hypothetical protein
MIKQFNLHILLFIETGRLITNGILVFTHKKGSSANTSTNSNQGNTF